MNKNTRERSPRTAQPPLGSTPRTTKRRLINIRRLAFGATKRHLTKVGQRTMLRRSAAMPSMHQARLTKYVAPRSLLSRRDRPAKPIDCSQQHWNPMPSKLATSSSPRRHAKRTFLAAGPPAQAPVANTQACQHPISPWTRQLEQMFAPAWPPSCTHPRRRPHPWQSKASHPRPEMTPSSS